MQREIGSNFWLDPCAAYPCKADPEPQMFHVGGADSAWLSTGRSAITYALRHIRCSGAKKTALLPPFTCHTVIQPFLNEGYEVVPYTVREDLTTDPKRLLEMVCTYRPSVLLFHHYFGFQTFPDVMADLSELGVTTIEDRTQCLYSGFPQYSADYTVASIRKWCGVPDGGFAVRKSGQFSDKPTVPDHALEQAKLKASYAKYRYICDNVGDKSAFLQMYREAEDILTAQNQLYSISNTAKLVQMNLQIDCMKQHRRNNFATLHRHLRGKWKLPFASLPDDVTPLYFPFFAEDRAEVQDQLRRKDIYAPIVWPQPEQYDAPNAAAMNLYEHLLCIPIDQRYDTEDMYRVIDALEHLK